MFNYTYMYIIMYKNARMCSRLAGGRGCTRRSHLQHVRTAHAHERRSRCQQLHSASSAGAGHHSKLLTLSSVVSIFLNISVLAQVYGDGKQTRSFQYVSDLVDGLMALMHGNYSQPVNIGNPEEYTIMQFAQRIKKLAGSFYD